MDDKNKTISIDSNLWSVSSKQNRSRKKKDQIKSKTEFDNKFTEQLNTLTEMLNKSKEPEYGILKNGNKPTYRTYMNTINNNNNNTAIENSILNSTSNDSTNNEINKIKLGLNYRKRTAKVQIRGKKSRRKIKKQIKDYDKESITEIKNFLYNNSLIKCGTNAPHDVLRELYKSAKLTGKVKNSNGEVLLHNYFNNPERTLE
tara:strand:- start:489 stop:1094 length:606 start_codon:yes stop_codon:yes gene_type:complete